MRRTATVLSGSACCVYGLTFTSHFYGARRSVGYVPFNSETLVTGKLFEDIRKAFNKLADPALYDAVVIINLCVPTASGVPLQLLPNAINGVRIIGIDVPGFGVPTHAEAKDVLAGAMLRYARTEAEQGPVQAPRGGKAERPTVTLLGEMFPADPIGIGMMLEPLGLAAGLWCRRASRANSATSTAAAPPPPVLHRLDPQFEAAAGGGGSARSGTLTAARSTRRRGLAAAAGRRGEGPVAAGDPGALSGARQTASRLRLRRLRAARGRCWSSGADLPTSAACPRKWSARSVARGEGSARRLPRFARAGPRGARRIRA
jgi:hypothetical protein